MKDITGMGTTGIGTDIDMGEPMKKTNKKKKAAKQSSVAAMVTRQDMWHVERVPEETLLPDFSQAVVGRRRIYIAPMALSIPGRGTHCLAYGACNYPSETLSWEVLFAAAHLLSKAPRSGDPSVLRFKGNAGSIERNLMKHYGLTLIRMPGGLVRAGYDTDDMLKISLERKRLQLNAKYVTYKRFYSLIDRSQIKSPKLRASFDQTYKEIVRQLDAVPALQADMKFLLDTPTPLTPDAPTASREPAPPKSREWDQAQAFAGKKTK